MSNGQLLLPTLLSTLSSERPSDAISAELADAIGFDHIELIMDILADRDNVVRKVKAHHMVLLS